ncbi:MAG: alpha/beta hydrolase, partial [Clostridia bacterium]|nr:alpha/beta hydrolase [Clostridia bacterium]
YRDKDICRAWIDYVVIMDPEAQIVLHGYSMGAVTIMLATGETLPEQVKAAVADCGFTTCWEQYANVIKHYAHLPSFPLLNAINVISIARGNFDIRKNRPIDAVARSVTPTVFLHGTADDFVKFEMMDRLYEACAAPKAKQAIEGGLHAASVEKDPALYWKTVDEFLKDYITV